MLWAFGYNLIALALASCGLLRPVLAAAIMTGSSILVVMNSLRLERLRDTGKLLTARTASAGESHRAGGLSPLPGT
jgi:Cu2+-exporting ATPase